MSHRTVLVLVLASLLLVSPVPLQAWELEDSTLKEVSIRGELHPLPVTLKADFDGDGILENVVRANAHVMLQTNGASRWQSPDSWQVQQAVVADLNQDGQPEVVLLVWRPFKTWPVDQWLPSNGRIKDFHDANNLSCHIILIGWEKGRFHERWAGSALAAPVKSFAIADLTGEGKQFLVTLESEYNSPLSAPAGHLKAWEWNGFGFSLVSEKDGLFHQLILALTDEGRVTILAP